MSKEIEDMDLNELLESLDETIAEEKETYENEVTQEKEPTQKDYDLLGSLDEDEILIMDD